MTGAHAYASLAQASKEGEKRLSVLKRVVQAQALKPVAKESAEKPKTTKTVKK